MRAPPMGLDETELLARWRDGDATAGQQLFRQYYKVVSRYLRNKVSGNVHADLVQKSFLACIRSSTQFRGASSFRTFLLRIAHQTLVDHFREVGRRVPGQRGHEVSMDDIVIADSFAELDAILSRRQEYRLLLAALRRLPFALQVVLELRYWESLRVREIAEVLGAPLGTVKTRLREGRIRLRRELERDDISPELLRSTMETLDSWSQRVRSGLGVLDDG